MHRLRRIVPNNRVVIRHEVHRYVFYVRLSFGKVITHNYFYVRLSTVRIQFSVISLFFTLFKKYVKNIRTSINLVLPFFDNFEVSLLSSTYVDRLYPRKLNYRLHGYVFLSIQLVCSTVLCILVLLLFSEYTTYVCPQTYLINYTDISMYVDPNVYF